MKKILYKNAVFVSMTGNDVRYGYMGTQGDRISYLGNVLPQDKYDSEVDLNGVYVFPTLCDSHVHLLYSIVLAASAFNICNIEDGKIKPDSLYGVEKAVREYAKCHPRQKLIVANQYVPSAINEGRLPTKNELDSWTDSREVIVFSIDGHSCAMSSAALKKIGIDSKDGILYGSEYDHSQSRVTGYVASGVGLSTIARGVANFTNQCLDYGIAKVCALDGEENEKGTDLLLTLTVLLARRMNIEVRLFPQYVNFDILKKLAKKMISPRIGGCSKWELDGSVGSHSAAFYNPFKDTGTISQTYYDDETVERKLREALEKGYTFTCHAIGTKAIDQITNAYEKFSKLIPKSGPRCRIDHFEFPSEKAVDFIKKNPVAVTMQPGYSYIDKRYIHSYEKNLGNTELSAMAPLKNMVYDNVLVLGSSDSPVQSVNPYQQMAGMMDYYDDSQSIGAFEALKTFTINAGIALDEKDGALIEGYKANFFTCKSEIVKMSSREIVNVQADSVYINGKAVKRKRGTVPEILLTFLKKPKRI